MKQRSIYGLEPLLCVPVRKIMTTFHVATARPFVKPSGLAPDCFCTAALVRYFTNVTLKSDKLNVIRKKNYCQVIYLGSRHFQSRHATFFLAIRMGMSE